MDSYVKEDICQFCLKQCSNYTCPRCNIRYCSSECYKNEKHLHCSEAFYEQCVLEELKQNFASPDDKKRVIEMLQKLNQEEEKLDSDDESIPDLTERIADLDIETDSDTVWEKLTIGEKEEFEAMIRDGCLGHLIPHWTPWWLDKELITEIGVTDQVLKNCPPIMKEIPPLMKLIPKTQAAIEVRYNLINALYSYLYITRLYNGDHLNCYKQAVDDLLAICQTLSCKNNFNCVGEAVHSCIMLLQQSSVPFDLQFSITILKDLEYVLIGHEKAKPFNLILVALSDLHKMFKLTRKACGKVKDIHSTTRHNSEPSIEWKNKLFHCEKKVEFFLSWVQEFGLDLKNCILELNIETLSFEKVVSVHSKTQDQFEKVWGSKRPPSKKKLIEELG